MGWFFLLVKLGEEVSSGATPSSFIVTGEYNLYLFLFNFHCCKVFAVKNEKLSASQLSKE